MLNKIIVDLVKIMPENLVWIFSKRYIAGKTLEDAERVTKQLNAQRVYTTIDVLGEYIKHTDEALEYKEGYLMTIDSVKANGLQATLSLKPSMFGLLIDHDFCYNNIRDVLIKARKTGVSICLDMEDSSCTDIEIELFEKFYQEFPETVSFVLQAYLRRTLDDLKRLHKINKKENPINIRICKGIYVEPEDIAYQKKNEVNKNYIDCLTYMIQNDFFCSIATHDKHLVKTAMELIETHKLSSERYEFQMLYGVRPELRKRIVEKGHHMRVYVPYGTHWFGYSTRRLQENPRMVTHIMKALLVRG